MPGRAEQDLRCLDLGGEGHAVLVPGHRPHIEQCPPGHRREAFDLGARRRGVDGQ
jgi:hypothetical protein